MIMHPNKDLDFISCTPKSFLTVKPRECQGFIALLHVLSPLPGVQDLELVS